MELFVFHALLYELRKWWSRSASHREADMVAMIVADCRSHEEAENGEKEFLSCIVVSSKGDTVRLPRSLRFTRRTRHLSYLCSSLDIIIGCSVMLVNTSRCIGCVKDIVVRRGA